MYAVGERHAATALRASTVTMRACAEGVRAIAPLADALEDAAEDGMSPAPWKFVANSTGRPSAPAEQPVSEANAATIKASKALTETRDVVLCAAAS